MKQERAASGDEGPSRKQGKLQRKRKREAAAAAVATAVVPPDSGASPVLADEAAAAGEYLASRVACVNSSRCSSILAGLGVPARHVSAVAVGCQCLLEAAAGTCRPMHITRHQQPQGTTPLACSHTWRHAAEDTAAWALPLYSHVHLYV